MIDLSRVDTSPEPSSDVVGEVGGQPLNPDVPQDQMFVPRYRDGSTKVATPGVPPVPESLSNVGGGF
jgi:hypothetical protein